MEAPGHAPDPAAGTTELLRGLLDDASLFPPAKLPMPAAVTAHLRHGKAWYADLVGPFVCPDTRLDELGTVLVASGVGWIDVALVVSRGAAALPAATDAVAANPRLRVRAIEVPAAKDADPASAVADVVRGLDAVPLAGARAYVEVPLAAFGDPACSADVLALIDGHGYRPKLRTGGVTSEAFPDESTLAASLVEIIERRIPFKCTAGLHRAVRHTASDTGFEHHGFLNVLLAVDVATGGAGDEDVASVLAVRDSASVGERIRALDPGAAGEIRSLFTSFGTCSIDEPVADLVSLAVLSKPGELVENEGR